jgi:hypothetical protein
MIPSVDERLASIIRALSEVILPHLPREASLAQEQAHLAIGHLQILRLQLDLAPAFEREELADAQAVGAALVAAITGGTATTAAIAALGASLSSADGPDERRQTAQIHEAVDVLVQAVSKDGAVGANTRLAGIILEHEQARVMKDRKWFLPFGFDTILEPTD